MNEVDGSRVTGHEPASRVESTKLKRRFLRVQT
jgi:hypothetical protein